ncbi:MAG: hypothetical protein NXI32_11965 [bacterium]|nr:hypothetical protein [bacterium]
MHEEELLKAVSQGLQFNDEFSLLPGNRFLQHSLVGIHQFESGDYSEAIENFDSALAASHFGSRFYWIEAFRHFASSEV